MCSPPAVPVVYVNTDGSGDYNCDGTDDQIQIQQALDNISSQGGGTVYLTGPNTYWISDTLFVGNNTAVTGDSDAVIKLVDDVGWTKFKAMIEQENPKGNHDIAIHGFTMDGNSENQTYYDETEGMNVVRGVNYHCQIWLRNCENVSIYNMEMRHGLWDFIRLEHDRIYENVTSSHPVQNVNYSVHDNYLYKCGHDAISLIDSGGSVVYSNEIVTRTNSGVRLISSNNADIYNNTIYSDWTEKQKSTGPAIEIQKESYYYMDNIEIHDNTVYDIVGSGIWMFAVDYDGIKRGNDIHIHHNTFTNVGQYWKFNGYSNSGIVLAAYNNTTIENNVFYNCGRSTISHIAYSTYNNVSNIPGLDLYGSGYTTVVRNNIIANTNFYSCIAMYSDEEAKNSFIAEISRFISEALICMKRDTGVAIFNDEESSHSFVTENNCIYNVSTAYYGENITSINDIYVDPLFADPMNRDYHLKSAAGRWSGSGWVSDTVTSPLIDAGYPASDYSNEPTPNGGRINIGRYGNTAEASKSTSNL